MLQRGAGLLTFDQPALLQYLEKKQTHIGTWVYHTYRCTAAWRNVKKWHQLFTRGATTSRHFTSSSMITNRHVKNVTRYKEPCVNRASIASLACRQGSVTGLRELFAMISIKAFEEQTNNACGKQGFYSYLLHWMYQMNAFNSFGYIHATWHLNLLRRIVCFTVPGACRG